jgi:pimeloyl-ACP methyl ester carboxylesterase
MAATAPSLGGTDRCGEDGVTSGYPAILRYPMQFFGFPEDSPAHRVEGFQDTAYEEAARAHNLRGQKADPEPLNHETGLYCSEPNIDTSMVKAPVYIYHGLADSVLAGVDPEAWNDAYPASDVTLRLYPGEGHDVQYRHLDQILLDIAGFANDTLVCIDGDEQRVPNHEVEQAVSGGATLGLCAWRP